MYCRNCGSKLGNNDKFCQYCGTKVDLIEEDDTDEIVVNDVDSDTDIFFGEEKIASNDVKRVNRDHIVVNVNSNSNANRQKENNGMAIAGLILAFIVPIVGLILSIIAYENAKKTGQPNRIALAGIIVAICSIVLSVVADIFAFGVLDFLY